jgi:RNA polymerase sigma factor (sigma-70 family)
MSAAHSSPPAFVTTRWTRVIAAGGTGENASAALSELCGQYYQPVVTFLRCSGHPEDHARELAHEFFARLLANPSIGNADPTRGRFRSYLLAAVKHFVADQRDRANAAKRGQRLEHVELKPATDTSPGVDPPDETLRSSEKEFDRQWALTILGQALDQLAEEHAATNRSGLLEILKPWLTGDSEALTQKEAAEQLGMNEGAIKVAIHRLRKRFRALVKDAVAQTVPDEANVNDELSYLISVIA